MRYLVLGCDPVGDRPLWEENEQHTVTLPVTVPSELSANLLSWNERMTSAVLAATNAVSALDGLNVEGESLAKQVGAAVVGGAKVRYLRE